MAQYIDPPSLDDVKTSFLEQIFILTALPVSVEQLESHYFYAQCGDALNFSNTLRRFGYNSFTKMIREWPELNFLDISFDQKTTMFYNARMPSDVRRHRPTEKIESNGVMIEIQDTLFLEPHMRHVNGRENFVRILAQLYKEGCQDDEGWISIETFQNRLTNAQSRMSNSAIEFKMAWKNVFPEVGKLQIVWDLITFQEIEVQKANEENLKALQLKTDPKLLLAKIEEDRIKANEFWKKFDDKFKAYTDQLKRDEEKAHQMRFNRPRIPLADIPSAVKQLDTEIAENSDVDDAVVEKEEKEDEQPVVVMENEKPAYTLTSKCVSDTDSDDDNRVENTAFQVVTKRRISAEVVTVDEVTVTQVVPNQQERIKTPIYEVETEADEVQEESQADAIIQEVVHEEINKPVLSAIDQIGEIDFNINTTATTTTDLLSEISFKPLPSVADKNVDFDVTNHFVAATTTSASKRLTEFKRIEESPTTQSNANSGETSNHIIHRKGPRTSFLRNCVQLAREFDLINDSLADVDHILPKKEKRIKKVEKDYEIIEKMGETFKELKKDYKINEKEHVIVENVDGAFDEPVVKDDKKKENEYEIVKNLDDAFRVKDDKEIEKSASGNIEPANQYPRDSNSNHNDEQSSSNRKSIQEFFSSKKEDSESPSTASSALFENSKPKEASLKSKYSNDPFETFFGIKKQTEQPLSTEALDDILSLYKNSEVKNEIKEAEIISLDFDVIDQPVTLPLNLDDLSI